MFLEYHFLGLGFTILQITVVHTKTGESYFYFFYLENEDILACLSYAANKERIELCA